MNRRAGFTKGLVAAAVAGLAVGAAILIVTASRPKPASALEIQERQRRIDRDLRGILTVAESSYVETGRYPKSIQEMFGQHPQVPFERLPRDPWKREYVFEFFEGRPRVICLGSDGLPGGEGEALDTVWVTGPEGHPEPERQQQPEPDPDWDLIPIPLPNRTPPIPDPFLDHD
jgi:hypothetical protein